jgi:hypothetical protein
MRSLYSPSGAEVGEPVTGLDLHHLKSSGFSR